MFRLMRLESPRKSLFIETQTVLGHFGHFGQNSHFGGVGSQEGKSTPRSQEAPSKKNIYTTPPRGGIFFRRESAKPPFVPPAFAPATRHSTRKPPLRTSRPRLSLSLVPQPTEQPAHRNATDASVRALAGSLRRQQIRARPSAHLPWHTIVPPPQQAVRPLPPPARPLSLFIASSRLHARPHLLVP